MNVVRQLKRIMRVCSVPMCRPARQNEEEEEVNLELFLCDVIYACDTYLDPTAQTFSVQTLKCHFNIIQINFASGDNQSNQLFVIGANAGHTFMETAGKEFGFICCTLQNCDESIHYVAAEFIVNCLFQSMTGQTFIFLTNL